ncbi:MAG: 23S rRNA (pseudouridine(1915)-N(3))-methyltransferase RlmH [Proteobacteria bacterium]|nr:23S rRNA (pseudouridine(1915)-N(3))-methyltransferase RlmH [Pseudomonadota bacterium]
MHITLVVTGKLKDPALKSLYEEYKKRFDWKIDLREVEEKVLEDALPPFSFLITLDERGENLRSEEFADLLNDIQLHHQGKATFIIGGADGLSAKIKAKAQKSLSFGRMTWPHLFVRIMLMEQIYRAQQILKHHPYHRGG